MSLAEKLFGSFSDRELKKINPITKKVLALETKYQPMSDAELQAQTPALKERLANVLLSVGTPGIPGGAIASFAALATMAGLPAGILGVYISINTLCDMGATCVNVIGDLACCVVLKNKIKIKE